MIAALSIVSLLLVVQTGYLLYYKTQIRDVARQLHFIGQHDSFKQITTQLHSQEITLLVNNCNEMLHARRELNQQFIQKNEEIHETIASLSHDIRTPLAALDGYLQLVEGTPSEPEHPGEHPDYMRLARMRIKGMTKLIDELFLYTKLQNPDYRLERIAVDAAELLRQSLFAQLASISETGHEPIVTLPEQAIVSGQPHAIERIFENVLSNYVYHGEGPLHIDCREGEQEWLFQFANLLPAGSRLDAARLFQRFYKSDTARSAQTSGLGLTIVQSLMQKMGGSVEVEQQERQFVLRMCWPKYRREENEPCV